VKLVDIVANASGSKSATPLNSNPFTPFELVSFTENYPAYQPSDEFQYFEISMRFKDDIDLDRPVLGGLSISMIADKENQDEIAVESSIVATFAYLPGSGLNVDEYAPAIELFGPTIEREKLDFFPLNLLPNLPLFPNHGNLVLNYGLENTGNIFLETSTQVKVEQLGIFGQLEGEVFTKTNEAFLVPGQKSQSTVEIAPPDFAYEQLGIGIYRFTTTAIGELGDISEASSSKQQTLVIFPWKQGLIALLLLILFRKRVFRSFNWVLGYARALRDFRYNPTAELNPKQEPAFDTVPKLESAPKLSETFLVPQLSETSVPVVGAGTAFTAGPKLHPETTADKVSEPEPFRAVNIQEPLNVKPEANPDVSAKTKWKLPKLHLLSIPKLTLPKLKLPKLNLSAASKAKLEALSKLKPRPTATNTPPATKDPSLETPQTNPAPAAQSVAPVDPKLATPTTPKPDSPSIRPSRSSSSSASPGTNSSSSGLRPLYPYWYQPPKKGSSS
jgi:hypothetical protein